MKKISLFLTLAAVALGFSSCSEDRDPVYQVPTSFVLNEPAMQDQYIDLTEKGTLQLVASQPDYGYSAVAQYSAEMSLDPEFKTFYELSAKSTLADFTVSQNEVAVGIMELQGITGDEAEEKFNEIYPNGCVYQKVYFRAICQLNGVESSRIVSNVVSYNNIKAFFAIKLPGSIYLIGAPNGWPAPAPAAEGSLKDWRLFEAKDAIGSHIYSGVFDIPQGQAMFRFYSELTSAGWDNPNTYGSQEPDASIEYPDFTANSLSTPVVNGKGNWSFPNWPGGKMTIVVDLSDANNMSVTFMAGEQSVVSAKYIYLVGSISGWMAPGTDNEEAYKNWRLADTDGSGIYKGSFPVQAGLNAFRFALNLTDEGWDNPTQIGSQAADANVDCIMTNGSFNGTYVNGKGNWAFTFDADGTLDLTVDTNNQTVNYVLH